jgi:V/A-type H+-transporting ATPase subunit I
VIEAQQEFGATWATVVISGWAPADRVEDVRQAVLQATDGQAVVEATPPEREEIEQGLVPTYVVHWRLLAPFERLVQMYGVVSYTEIEPTAMLAVTFLLMFGIMFGDLGHGFCLVVIGLLAWRMDKRAAVRDVGHVVAASGVVSMLFGTFVQGSVFGMSLADMGFPFTLGFEPIRFGGQGGSSSDNVMRYLLLAMALGIVLISLGAVLNVVNRVRQGDYEGGLLGRFGVTGLLLYWGLLGLAIKQAVGGLGREDLWLAGAAVGLPFIVLILHEPLHQVLARREPISAGGMAVSLVQGLFEGVETVMLFLSNTLSFLRVAAFALSHAALCFAIFMVQRMVNNLPGNVLWSAIVFVLGTALIIGLEGLIVGIQILRLEFYEFFTKFFQAGGLPYKPFRLD